MSLDRGILRRRGWRKLAWLLTSLLFCLAAVVVFFPNSLLNQHVASGLTNYLVSRLGPEAICAEVDLGFRHISLRDVLLPLDDEGTMLSISRIDVRIDPLIALSQPGEYARILQSVNIISPELILKLPIKSTRPKSGRPIPDGLFKALESVDSLRSLTFESGKFTVLVRDSIVFRLRDLRGGISQTSTGFDVFAAGKSEVPTKLDIRLAGEVSPLRRELSIAADMQLEANELALNVRPLEGVAMNGGSAHIMVQQDSARFSLEGGLNLDDVELRIAKQSVYVPEAILSLRDGVVRWDSLLVHGIGIRAVTSGSLNVNDSLRIDGQVNAKADLGDVFSTFGSPDSSVKGSVAASAVVGGLLKSPFVSVTLTGDNFSFKGQFVDSLSARIDFRDSTLTLLDCGVWNSLGRARADGSISLGEQATTEISGELIPRQIPKLLGQSSTVERAEFAISSQGHEMDLRWLIRDSSGSALGNGTAVQNGPNWYLQFFDPSGHAGTVAVYNEADDWSVSATTAHIVVPIVYPGTGELLGTVDRFEFTFSGDDEYGTSELSIQSDSTKRTAIARVINRLDFDGTYEKLGEGEYDFGGSWHGISGEGEEFFGKGDVRLDEQKLTITNLYIDEAGSLTGSVRIDSTDVDMSMSIEQLPLTRIPFVAGFADRWKLGGVLSGEVSAVGPADSLKW